VKKTEYKKEFFDKEYSAKEAYARLWRYASKYKLRLAVGIVCGILTAGTLVPIFQVVRPFLSAVVNVQNGGEAGQGGAVKGEPGGEGREEPARLDQPASRPEGHAGKVAAQSKAKAEGLSNDYDKVRAWIADHLGIELQSKEEALGLPLLTLLVVVVPIFVIVRFTLVFLAHYCLAWAGMRTVRDIRCDIMRHVQSQSMQFHGRIDVGQLMTRATTDPQQTQMVIQVVLQELAQGPFEILVSVGFIIWSAIQSQMLGTLFLIAVGFPAFVCPVVFLSKRVRKWSRKAMERFSVVGGRLHEVLTCIRAVKAYNTEEFENRRYARANTETLKATLRALRWGLFVGPAVEAMGVMLLLAFAVWCFFERVTLADIIPMVVPLVVIYKPVKQILRLPVQVEQGRAALARIWSLLDVKMELPERADAPEKRTFDDRIVFDHVTFRYDGADHDAVKDASFEIPRGKVVAVVGGTGSGKTTISGLLARFYDPASGRVTMDGVDLRDMRVADLRSLVGSVQQETLLFNDTIENNIKYGSPDATHEEVVAAAKLANAHDFIMSQPEGYERLAGEKGFALSGGERQRIAIARAILKNPPVLILDEATSALDTVTERLVQDAINNLMKDRTTFAIAHRLSTIRNADMILVMQDGVIVERGTHDELYASNGVYRRLCDMQNQK